MTAERSKRLTQDRWLHAGLAVLQSHGADAIKAEPLARHLDTTKGSFYWHFKDVPSFHSGLLSLWSTAAQAQTTRILDSADHSAIRLRALAQSLAAPDPADPVLSCESAIRAWSRTYQPARNTVQDIDVLRLGHLQNLLSQIGIANPEMARILYAAAIGMMDMTHHDDARNTDTIGTMVDLIVALR